MKLSEEQKQLVLTASAKSLATYSPSHGINVVPVSTIQVGEGTLTLYNYFMNKTLANIREYETVSLCAWSGETGIQTKGRASYQEYTGNEHLDDEANQVHHRVRPRGRLTIEIIEVFDVSIPK